MSTLIQDMIESAMACTRDMSLPNQRFFTPKAPFWEELRKLDSKWVDCGCGGGDTVAEAKDNRVAMTGCDVIKRFGSDHSHLVHILPAHKFYFSESLSALICRPDHSGWCEDLINLCLSKGSKVVYVGLLKNLAEDCPLDLPHIVLHRDVGLKGEIMVLFDTKEKLQELRT